MKLIVEREFTTAEAGDIAITAAEGGINYWAVVDQYQPSRWAPWVAGVSATADNTEVPEDFVFYTIVAIKGTEATLDDLRDDCVARDFNMNLNVTPLVIARGIQLFLSGQHEYAASMGTTFADMEDLAAMDSAEADFVVQLGVFGKVIFG